MHRTLILGDNQDMQTGSIDDTIRTTLSAFAGDAWDTGHATALAVFISSNEGSLHTRLTHALQAGIRAALECMPEDERPQLDEASQRHFAAARTRLQSSLPNKGQQLKEVVQR